MKEREIVKTKDGSHTIFVPELNEHYHSSYGAIQESRHIYIENAFKKIDKSYIKVLELGFGTGLNCLLTALEAKKTNKGVIYFGVEKYPLDNEEIGKINYAKLLNAEDLFKRIHEIKWGPLSNLTPTFAIVKEKKDIKDFTSSLVFDIIYFDAFAPNVQPDLWTTEIFKKLYKKLSINGILITYSSKGTVKQALRDANFFVQRLAGPEGKRHIISATKKYKGKAPNKLFEEETATATK